MKTELFNYNLPQELIAQTPAAERSGARLMVVDRKTGNITHRKFSQITDYFRPGDLLVLNNTRVIPARIFGSDTRKREILLIKQTAPLDWDTFIRPKRGIKIGNHIDFNHNSLSAVIESQNEDGTFSLHFSQPVPLDKIGYPPLPPYIKRDYNRPEYHDNDRVRYQTVYAEKPGAIAAPTAGLHFTHSLLQDIKDKGVAVTAVTLHVGIGTFRPVRTETLEDHRMIPEEFIIPKQTTDSLKNAVRVVAAGTTTVRALETAIGGSGSTNMFIYPPYRFKTVNALITNFHLPRSTLLMLVSAFAGRDLIMSAYQEAIKEKYRFYSYGDAMLII